MYDDRDKSRPLLLRNWIAVVIALFLPPVGIVIALRFDGPSLGTLSLMGISALALAGLAVLMPKIPTRLFRIVVSILYLWLEAVVMFVIAAHLVCAWYRACM